MGSRRFALSCRAVVPMVGLLSVAVSVAGLQAPAQGRPLTAVAPTAVPVLDNSTRPDAISAMVTARATGQPVEDLSQRTETVRVFANPDGTWTSEGTTGPERVQDEQGVWQDVDTTLVESGDGFMPVAASSDLVLSDGGDKVFASLTDERGKRLEFQWPTTLPTPVVEGDTATYRDALAGVGDLVVTATSTGFTHNIVIPAEPTAPVNVTIPVTTHGADLVENSSGELAVEEQSGDKMVAAARPLMWDSSDNAGGEPQTAPVDTTVGQTASGTPALTLSPDDDFLSDPATVYPVTVDPSFTINPTGDTWLQYPDYTSSQGASGQLKVGTYDGGGHKARSFLQFDNGDAKWSGVHVLHAALKLRNFDSASCTGAAIRATRITEDWTVPGLTWGNQPSVGADKYDDFFQAKGYDASCAEGDATWDLTEMVQGWHDGFPNHGVRLKAEDESSNNTWRRYRSDNYGTVSQRPRLIVDYNTRPATPAAPAVSPGNSGYTTTSTPTFDATVSDPDGGTVRGVFEVYQDASLVWSGTSSYVSSGSTASKTVPSGILANGTGYIVKLKSNDGTDDSRSYSGSTAFTVDTTKPTATVTSSAFTNGQWTTDVPAVNAFTFNGAGDTKSFAYRLDGVTQPVQAADTNGDANVSWLPKSGSHTLTLTPTDRAGNVGAAVTFTFGVGAASFTVPNAAARSTGVFPVQLSGPPNATGASLSWRYAGQTAWNPADGVTKAGATWTGAVANNASASSSGALLWDALGQEDPASTTDPKATVAAPALLELRTCFSYTGTPSQVCSSPRPVQLVPSAFERNFPVTDLGPATVALFTGEATITEPDAVDTTAGVGRTFSSFDPATATTGPFGPGWSTSLLAPGDAGADLVDHRAKDRTFVVVTAGGSSQMFTATDPDVDLLHPTGPVPFRPAGTDDGSSLVLDGSTVTLTRPQASTTTWQQDGDAWVLAEAGADQDPDSPAEASFDFTDPGYPTWIAQTEPGLATTCTPTEQASGCRGLKVSYSGTGRDRRVTMIERITHDTAPLTLASYTYTPAGLLEQVCGTDPDGSGPLTPLCASYGYDTTTVAGRTLLKMLTPPGQKAWQFGYDSTGRLVKVTRALDANTNTGTGPATWTVRYDLAPTTAGLPDLTPASAAQWGQDTAPTTAFAVFDPSDPNTTDLTFADLWYTDANGTTTNTAVHGNTTPDGSGTGQWLVDTRWYDDHGNVIQTLDGAGRARALQADPGDRPAVAFDASALTVYNEEGNRVEDEYGPVHTATITDGTTGPYRTHTAYVYDDEAPTLGGGDKPALPEDQASFDLVVETRHSATDADMVGAHDTTVVRNDYAPVVAGDGNGWQLGTPTRVKVQLADGSWSTTTTRYDTEGRQIETRQPGGATAADGSGTDAHATMATYYATGAGDPDCRTDDPAHPERTPWAGQLCKTGPAGQPDGPSMPVTYAATYNVDLEATQVRETSGSTTRTTTTSYDTLGRPVTVTITDGTDTRTETIDYDRTTGLQVSQRSGSGSVATRYDTWGRPWTYTDATGTVSTTTYTTDGQAATRNDGTGAYTYGYDSTTGEHRRLPSTVKFGLSDGIPDTFTLTHDAAGAPTRLAYPNGMAATYGYDQVGVPTTLEYTDSPGLTLLSFTNTLDVDGRVIAAGSDASEQHYTYDPLGRLTEVRDTRAGQCTTRRYGFSAASERTAFTSYSADSDGGCQTTTSAVSKTNTYDSANRIRNTGYTYDSLGRTLTIPSGDTAPGATGPLTATYYANDMVKTLTQTVDNGQGATATRETSYGLDPSGRINTVTNKTGGTEIGQLRYRFSDESDVPTSIQTTTDGGTTWSTTRYVSAPGLGLVASVTGTDLTYQIANLHGDVVATFAGDPTSTGIDGYTETDEFGNVVDREIAREYGWLGTYQRSNDTQGGLLLMGARLFNPASGQFTSRDVVANGNETAYNYPNDPVNEQDTSGQFCVLGVGGDCPHWVTNRYGHHVYIRDKARDHVWDGHRIQLRTIMYVIRHGWSLGPNYRRPGRMNYQYVLREYRFYLNSGLIPTGRLVRIIYAIDWYSYEDGKQGGLVTMYCAGYHGFCPEWVRTDPLLPG